MSESDLQKKIQVDCSKFGARMFRNNCGMAKTDTGRYIRYGVANPGGSDLIGWTPIRITNDMIGKYVAVFTAIECKKIGGRATEKQLHFIQTVKKSGGIAVLARSFDNVVKAISNFLTVEEERNGEGV